MSSVLKFACILLVFSSPFHANTSRSGPRQREPRFTMLVLYERGGHHLLFSQRARVWLDKLSQDSNFNVQYINNTDSITKPLLDRFQVFFQLDYVPYGWRSPAMQAFEDYMSAKGHGWVGLHHASLLGDFDGYPLWHWFYNFMGSIIWKNYIATFADATVHVEDSTHPCVRNLPRSFSIASEEWYIYDRSPRAHVHVLASVDESSYRPDSGIKMGDHPVIWSNDSVPARNLYIFMGHSPTLFDNEAYTTLLQNALFWAGHQ